jgi:peptidoglycan DL-endopeptidase CwlO
MPSSSHHVRSSATAPAPRQGAAPIPTDRARRIRRPVACLVSVLGIALAAPASLTYADPSAVQEQRDEVQRLEAQLEGIDARAARAAEAYNGARWRLGQVESRIADNQRTVRTTRVRLRAARTVLTTRLREIYASPPPSLVQVMVSSGSITSAVDGVALLDRIGERDAGVVRGIRSDLSRLQEIRAQLVEDRGEATRQVAEAERRRAEVLTLLQERRRVLDSARGELRRRIQAEEERRRQEAERQRQRALAAQRAAEAARAQAAPSAPSSSPAAPTSSSSSGGGGGGGTTYAPAAGGANARAAAIAMRYLGTPYVWGGASPSGFDCSGLASYAYAQVGKSVPHYTGAIWAAFPKVAPGDLQAGDLVFFHADLHHMGIYIGNGQFVHAPHTGDVVKVSSLAERGSTFVGAVRP